MPAAVFIFIGWLVVILFIVASIVKVPDDFAYVVTTLGRARRVLDPGLHLVVPMVSHIAARISLLDQVLDVPVASCVMSNGKAVALKGTVRFRVTDPARAVTEVADFRAALLTLATSHWTRALDEADPHDALNAVRSSEPTIRTAAEAWGIEVLNASPILVLDDDAMSLLGRGETRTNGA